MVLIFSFRVMYVILCFCSSTNKMHSENHFYSIVLKICKKWLINVWPWLRSLRSFGNLWICARSFNWSMNRAAGLEVRIGMHMIFFKKRTFSLRDFQKRVLEKLIHSHCVCLCVINLSIKSLIIIYGELCSSHKARWDLKICNRQSMYVNALIVK